MRKNKIKKNELETLFEEATIAAAELKGKKLLEEAKKDPYYPSAEFNHRIHSLIESKTKKTEPLAFFNKVFLVYSRASAWILLALVLLFVTVPNIASARNWVTKLVMDSNPKYVSYYFQNNETYVSNLESNKTGLFPEGTYYPAYLPREMKLVQLIYKESTMTYRFQDTEENYLMIQVSGIGSTTNVDNENLDEQSTVIVNGMQATYSSKADMKSIIWSDEAHLFIVNSTLPKEECIRIANGLMN